MLEISLKFKLYEFKLLIGKLAMSNKTLKAGFTLKKNYDYYNTWDKAEPTYNNQEGTLEICGMPVMERW